MVKVVKVLSRATLPERAKLTVEVLPRQPYNDRTKTLGTVGRDVRRESKRERRRDERGDSHGSCRWPTCCDVDEHETWESVPFEFF